MTYLLIIGAFILGYRTALFCTRAYLEDIESRRAEHLRRLYQMSLTPTRQPVELRRVK